MIYYRRTDTAGIGAYPETLTEFDYDHSYYRHILRCPNGQVWELTRASLDYIYTTSKPEERGGYA